MSRKARAKVGPKPPGLWLPRLLLGAAAAVDAYLLSVSAAGGAVAGCGPESSCHAVLSSRWAYWFNVPVSAPALLICALAFTATFWVEDQRAGQSERWAWRIVLSCATAFLAAGVWFVGIQLFLLRAICPYCMAAHLFGMSGAAVLVRIALSRRPMAGPVAPWIAGGVAAVAVLIAGQLLYAPRSYVTTPITAGVATAPSSAAPREFQIFEGQFRFRLDEVPLMGRPEAQHVLVSLFDYTCHHCRQVHPVLVEAQRQFSNHLAIVNVPMPLDGQCNPLIRRPLPPHTNACALARIGLAVWRADRTKSGEFDEWVFGPPTPPEPAAAEAHARHLVGATAFDRERTNQWIDTQIRQDVAIYEAVYRKFRKSAMPEVIIGTNLISGVFSSAQLAAMLAEQFGLTNAVHAPAP